MRSGPQTSLQVWTTQLYRPLELDQFKPHQAPGSKGHDGVSRHHAKDDLDMALAPDFDRSRAVENCVVIFIL